ELRPAGSSTWNSANTTSTSTRASNLSRNTTYEWRVRSVCSGSTSDWSAICSFVAGGGNNQSCGGGLVFGGTTINTDVEGFVIYPNPVSEVVNISLPNDVKPNATVRLLNAFGQVVSVQQVDLGNFTIQQDVANFAPGLYFIQLKNGNETMTQKVIVR
ncbi:MAG: T9SS type A sorting domain-containing protein, partial [Saprospiraceae bacterium]